MDTLSIRVLFALAYDRARNTTRATRSRPACSPRHGTPRADLARRHAGPGAAHGARADAHSPPLRCPGSATTVPRSTRQPGAVPERFSRETHPDDGGWPGRRAALYISVTSAMIRTAASSSRSMKPESLSSHTACQ
jgi:hypothetical protein